MSACGSAMRLLYQRECRVPPNAELHSLLLLRADSKTDTLGRLPSSVSASRPRTVKKNPDADYADYADYADCSRVRTVA